MTVAVVGIVSAMGFFSMSSVIGSERARNEAVRFASEVRRHRAEAMQQQMYSFVTTQATAGGVRVSFSAKRLGETGSTPCELMQRGTSDIVTSTVYDSVTIRPTQLGGSSTTLCFTPFGKPMTTDLQNSDPKSLDVVSQVTSTSSLTLSVDALGSISSSDQPTATGIAQTSLFPLDLMATESAPVPPNLDDITEGAVYEVAPNDYVDADGAPVGDPLLGGADDPCAYDPAYCTVDPCAVDPVSCYGYIP